jgi:hypothetical protein
LEFFPSTFSSEVKKNLGRWKGSSFSKYIRNPDPKNRWIFKEVSEFLIKKLFAQVSERVRPENGSGFWIAAARSQKSQPPTLTLTTTSAKTRKRKK